MTVLWAMKEVRCSCGRVHETRSLRPVGRQYGDRGEYYELANCPACGSTICAGTNVRQPSGVRLRVAAPSTSMRRAR
jgi:hypothetical protein